MIVYAQDGFPIELAEPLNKGAEGRVCLLAKNPSRAVKLYRDEDYAEAKRAKIQAMVAIAAKPDFAESLLAKRTAWPIGLVFSDPGAKHFAGFGMRAAATDLTMADMFAYPPSPKAQQIGMLGRAGFLWELCKLFGAMHAKGYVIGDPNDDNIGVSGGRPFLFDMDSIHFETESGSFRCPCVQPLYRAPELGRVKAPWTFETYPGETFTEYTDRYALAVLIFRTLFNGAHPFACVPIQGENRPQRSIAQRAAAGESPFFARIEGFQAPAYAPPTDDFPAELIEAFRRAFIDGAKNPRIRPDTIQWKAILHCLLFDSPTIPCDKNPDHIRWNGKECPYCKADQQFERATKTAARHG